MGLFIQIQDGVPINHHIFEDNMQQLFPENNLETAPIGFAKFVRVDPPTLGVYEKMDNSKGHEGCGCEYEATDDGFQDVWHTVNMTSGEREIKKNECKPDFLNTWIFDEATCIWSAPVSYPDDGAMYVWREADSSWIPTNGSAPTDGQPYYFSLSDMAWTVLDAPPTEEGYIFNYQIGEWVDE